MDYIHSFFIRQRPRLGELVDQPLDVDDVEAVLDEGQAIYEEMSADCAYADEPKHAMAASLFFSNVNLALFVALRNRGVDAHQYGAAMLSQLSTAPMPPAEPPDNPGAITKQPGTHPGEFAVELVPSDDPEHAWGMNITSCAVCHQFGRYDAMDLVPYMCASDDVMSDIRGEGLRRTGTIALGATHCDFRYHIGGEPAKVAELAPERIRIVAD